MRFTCSIDGTKLANYPNGHTTRQIAQAAVECGARLVENAGQFEIVFTPDVSHRCEKQAFLRRVWLKEKWAEINRRLSAMPFEEDEILTADLEFAE